MFANPPRLGVVNKVGAVIALTGLAALCAHPVAAHTNSVGFDLTDLGDGSCTLEWYYGSWHSNQNIGPEGAFSLYTLGSSAELQGPDWERVLRPMPLIRVTMCMKPTALGAL